MAPTSGSAGDCQRGISLGTIYAPFVTADAERRIQLSATVGEVGAMSRSIVKIVNQPHAPQRQTCWSGTRPTFRLGGFLLLGAFLYSGGTGWCLPSYARQLNMPCIACHTEYPILTEMGRQFKLSGYTLSADSTALPPIAFMLQPSFTRTQAGQAGGAAPSFGDNNNFAVSQASIFYAGRLFGPYATDLFGAGSSAATFLNHFGIFNQTTYDGVGKAWSWDNTDVRYADLGSIAGHALTYGLYLNNNPTLQDPWNSTPAFAFPFSGSGLAPTPAAAPLIDGRFAGQVAGLGAYTMVDGSYYADLGAYRSIGSRYQRALGVDPSGETEIAGIAPYFRVAYTRPAGNGTWESGIFGLAPGTYPGRVSSAGTDRTVDVGVDSQIQESSGRHDLTVLVTAIYESEKNHASLPLGDSSNPRDHLLEAKVTCDYLYDKTYGFAVQPFTVSGSSDALLYPTSQSGSPNSYGVIFQGNYLPMNKNGGPPFWPRSNIKFSIQYVYYGRFDGSINNTDGSGRTARDNNTLYLEAWIVF